MNRKYSTRTFSEIDHVRAEGLLNELLREDATFDEYRTAMFNIGELLGEHLSKTLNPRKKYCVVSTVEDADFLAKGIIESLSRISSNIFLVCLWNERSTMPGTNVSVAPIYNRFYQNGYETSDDVIIVKSIISGSCVVRANISEIVERSRPEYIHVVAPIMHSHSQEKLKIEFPETISERFQFTYLAIDEQRDELSGEVIPGIGGNVYQKLGFKSQADKNCYVPEIVRERYYA